MLAALFLFSPPLPLAQLLPFIPAGHRESSRRCSPGWPLGACTPFSLRMHGRGVEGLVGCGTGPAVMTRLVSAAGSGAGDGAGVHSRPGGGRHHRQEGAAHQTALPFRQRLHQGDLLCVLPGPRCGSALLPSPSASAARCPFWPVLGPLSCGMAEIHSTEQNWVLCRIVPIFRLGRRRQYCSLEKEGSVCHVLTWVQIPIPRL